MIHKLDRCLHASSLFLFLLRRTFDPSLRHAVRDEHIRHGLDLLPLHHDLERVRLALHRRDCPSIRIRATATPQRAQTRRRARAHPAQLLRELVRLEPERLVPGEERARLAALADLDDDRRGPQLALLAHGLAAVRADLVPGLHVRAHAPQDVVAPQELGRGRLALVRDGARERVVRADVDVLLVVGVDEPVCGDVGVEYGLNLSDGVEGGRAA